MIEEKSLGEKSVDELLVEYGRLNRLIKKKSRKRGVGEDGALLLNPDDPRDREWYEDNYYEN